MKLKEKLMEILGFEKKDSLQKSKTGKSKKKSKNETIPREIADKLPKGVIIKKIELGPKQILKFIIYVVLVFLILNTIKQLFNTEQINKVPLSEAIDVIKSGKSDEITVLDNDILVKLKNSSTVLVTQKEAGVSVAEFLQKEGVDMGKTKLNIENRTLWKTLGDILGMLLSIGLPILFIVWFFGRQTGGAGGMFGFGKSTAKLFVKGKQSIRFKDVAGVEEAKKDLEEVVDFLKNPEKYRKMGARAPKGVLLVGPSGVGKTLLARAVAGEAGVSFYSMAGSEFMEMLVGVGASRVRDLFGTAKKSGKAIIFIDEIDAIGRMRGGVEGGHGEREQTLNQILVEMDGFEANTTVVVLAATNRGDLLDPALTRPGRFDRRVVLEMPDLSAREGILKIHAKGKPFEEDVDWVAVARRTVGFSGADLENMLNEAAIAAARGDKQKIDSNDIEEAALKVKLGRQKKRNQTEDDRKMTAYHEAGHAIVNFKLDLDPVTRISIVSRGQALGFTLVPPSRDKIHETKSNLLKRITMTMGGRAAEEIVFKDITTGAAADISQATSIARDMVIEWGMSDLGPINLGPQIDIDDWGKTYAEPSRVSDEMQAKIDGEIRKIINNQFEDSKKVVFDNREKLDQLATRLIEKETIDQKEFEEVMRTKSL